MHYNIMPNKILQPETDVLKDKSAAFIVLRLMCHMAALTVALQTMQGQELVNTLNMHYSNTQHCSKARDN